MTNLNAVIVLLVFAGSVYTAFAEPVVWTDLKGVAVEGNKITKDIPIRGWSNTFAKASTPIINGTGIVEFSAPQNDKWVTLKFNDTPTGDVWSGTLAIALQDGAYQVMADRKMIFRSEYSAGDVFKAEFKSNHFKIFHNNNHITTKITSLPNQLFVYFAAYTPFAAISDVTISGPRDSVLNPSLKKSLSSMNDIFGDLFGMPIVFLFLVFIASIFTPKNAHIGILILGFLIAIMIAFELITISAEVFGLIIVIIALGLFVGRKKS